MAHQGSGIVLKTSFDQKGNRILRTIFEKRYVTYQTITDYIPPLFIVVNYEQAAFGRECFSRHLSGLRNRMHRNDSTGCSAKGPTLENDPRSTDTSVKTDEVLCDNVRFVESLLVAADCGYDACQLTFLRLETAGDFQRSFDRLYPLWNVGVGALVRLSFSTWHARTRALKVLATNAANNQDVYAVNFAANASAVTIVDYLEPLFAYCAKKTRTDGHDTDFCARSSSGPVGGTKRASFAAAAANTTQMFEINFCVIDEPPVGYRKSVIDEWSVSRKEHNGTSVYSSVGGSAAGTGVSKRSANSKRKRENSGSSSTTGDTDKQQLTIDFDVGGHANKVKRGDSAIVEKQRALCGSLSVHDVRPYFARLQSKRLTRISMDQLEELPVTMIRCERYFCAITCRVFDRSDNESTVLNVYYCWNPEVHEFLSAFADICNNRQRRANTTRIMVAVSPLCTEDVEARLNMLLDLKNVIWKDNINAYIRLAISESHDSEMLARNFYEPLVFHVQRTTADLETEIKRSVTSSMTAGSRDMFRNAISLDCSRLCNDLDPTKCAFARTYKRLLDDSTFACNGSVRIDHQTLNGSVVSRQNAMRLLERGQDYCNRLVTEFCTEQILDLAFEMATELRIGLLDAFGLKYTDQQTGYRSATGFDASGPSSTDESVFDTYRVANMVFMDALANMSVYTGTCGSVSSCNEFFSREKNAKPLLQFVRGLYTHDLLEFDLQSAYPTITALYNISPETTAIVTRDSLKRLDESLIAVIIDDTSRSQQGLHTNNVMTSFYNQIGHLNETDSNLVVVSLRREIYAGFLPRIMERLVLTRRNHNQLLNPFYKKLANVVYGCTGKANAFNDLFSPQCASAIRSMCRSVMTKTLQNIPPEHVVLTQTDGALLYAGDRDETTVAADKPTCKQFEAMIRASLEVVRADVGCTNTATLPLEPRVRGVSMCLVVDQNRHIITYKDGKTSCKGQEGQSVSYGDARIKEALLSTISKFAIERLTTASENVSIELNGLMAFCFNFLDTVNLETRPDWFLTIAVPSTNDSLFNATSQKNLIGFRLDGYCKDECLERLADTSVAKFGDTVAVWPVLLNENGEVSREFRVTRPLYNVAVRPNYVFVLKSFLWYWVKWLFTIRYVDQDEMQLTRMFHAICKEHERRMVLETTTM